MHHMSQPGFWMKFDDFFGEMDKGKLTNMMANTADGQQEKHVYMFLTIYLITCTSTILQKWNHSTPEQLNQVVHISSPLSQELMKECLHLREA